MAKQLTNPKSSNVNCIPASFVYAPSSVKSEKINSLPSSFGKKGK